MRQKTLLALALGSVLAVTGLTPAFGSVGEAATLPCAQPDGRVDAMAISGGVLYIGGDFTHVADKAGVVRVRTRLAAVDTTTCELTDWTAAADANVAALAVTGGVVYVGGSFLHLGGQVRTRLAAVDASSATVLPFSPAPNKPVRALVAAQGRLYVGGEFAKVGSATRSKLAAFSLATGGLDGSWVPAATGKVDTLGVGGTGTDVYVGGRFTALNGQTAYAYLAAVNSVSGAIDPTFAPHSPFPIDKVVVDSRGVYAGGAGHGGHVVVWNLDGSLQRPIFQTDGDVQGVAVDGNSVYAGGHFTNYCVGNTGAGAPFICDVPLERRKLLEVSLGTGQLTSWAPALDSPFGVLSAVVDPATHALWVGGDFTDVSGQDVAHLAKLT